VRVLGACSLGGAGHLRPLAPFLAAAQRRGDDVRVIGPPALREMVEAEGLAFVPGGEPPESDIAPIREQLAVAPPLEASVLGNRELFGRLAADAMLPAVDRIVEEWQPDLVLRDPAEFASAIVAARRSVPVVQVAISLAEVEAGSLAVAAPALDRHGAGMTDALRAVPYLTRFPGALDPSPFPTTIRYHDGDGATARALGDWWPASPTPAPLVYATFGTVLGFMSMAADVFKVALAGVAPLDTRVLVTVGRQLDIEALGAVPDHVHVEPWVDQADVLAVADVVVCHGGSGTVYGALAAGVPLVVVPVFADQFENARRVAASGAGLVVEQQPVDPGGARVPIAMNAAPRITRAIEHVLSNPSLRARAHTIAAEMAATPTVAEALDRAGA
jgi:UDP:flavonoid glycosyltransferase YjiC (YdhE family)